MSENEPTSQKSVEQFLDRWMNDPSFKDQIRSDPTAALQSCGIDATAEMVNAMKTVSPDTSVEELKERVVKWGWWPGRGI